jgi:hypothetical protein
MFIETTYYSQCREEQVGYNNFGQPRIELQRVEINDMAGLVFVSNQERALESGCVFALLLKSWRSSACGMTYHQYGRVYQTSRNKDEVVEIGTQGTITEVV